jgi:hypothetical protein
VVFFGGGGQMCILIMLTSSSEMSIVQHDTFFQDIFLLTA